MLWNILRQIDRLATYPQLPWEAVYHQTVAMTEHERLQHLASLQLAGGTPATISFVASLKRAVVYITIRSHLVNAMEIFVVGLYILLLLATYLSFFRLFHRIERQKQSKQKKVQQLQILGSRAPEDV